MNIADFPDDSESSDEDYVPEGFNVELPSEEESDGDVEDDLTSTDSSAKRGTKRQKKSTKSKKKRKNNTEDADSFGTPKENGSQEKQKEDTNSLWADFIKDTGFKTRAERLQTPTTSNEETKTIDDKQNATKVEKSEPPKKVTVTEVYKFAGEEVKVVKEIIADTPEARLSANKLQPNSSSGKSAGGGRLNSILSNLGKKPKINTLEKSKLDWEQFKKDEKIEDELQAYGKSKDGYLEKQDFLQRADLRRFEIERGIRDTLRNNRMNNVNM